MARQRSSNRGNGTSASRGNLRTTVIRGYRRSHALAIDTIRWINVGLCQTIVGVASAGFRCAAKLDRPIWKSAAIRALMEVLRSKTGTRSESLTTKVCEIAPNGCFAGSHRDVEDRDGAGLVLDKIRRGFPRRSANRIVKDLRQSVWLRRGCADSGHPHDADRAAGFDPRGCLSAKTSPAP
jgi:hypothetical protein